MKKLLILVLLFSCKCFATNYYVSSSGSDSNNGLSTGAPFQTLSKIETLSNNGTIVAGDSILFKRGESFAGALNISSTGGRHAKSGTDLLHIVWATYGTGAKPLFLYPGSATGSGTDSRTILLLVGVRRWDFVNLHFTDTDHTNDKKTGAHVGFTLYLGSPGSTKTNRCAITDCDFDYVAMGPVLSGDSNTITRCNLTNFKDLLGASGSGDYGANAFTILEGLYNIISYCYVHDAYAQSTTFGFNGGVCEMFGGCSYNEIIYCIFIDCNGVSEFGSNGAGVTCTDNYYVGNIVLSCGALFYANISGLFTVEVKNTFAWNNTHIETTYSRMSGPNCGHGLPDSATLHAIINCDSRAMGNNGSPTGPVVYDSKNNIFWYTTGMDVYQSGTGTKTNNRYNLYKLSNGSVENKSLGTGETNASVAIFVQTTGNDPSTYDLNLAASSEAKGTGPTDALFPNDMYGHPFANNMGALGPVPASNVIRFPSYWNNVLYGGIN